MRKINKQIGMTKKLVGYIYMLIMYYIIFSVPINLREIYAFTVEVILKIDKHL